MIDRLDPRRDTEGVGIMCCWSVLYSLFNLANTFYSYLHTQPSTILLAYLLSYLSFAYFIYKLQYTLVQVNRDGIPKLNNRTWYRKGKYKNSTSRPKCKHRRSRQKRQPRRKPFRPRNKHKPDYGGWGSVHKWIPLLDYDYSNYFNLNCNHLIII